MSLERAKAAIAVRRKGAVAPDDAQLAQIRPYMLADVPAEQLYVRTFVIAHNCIDRDEEVFDEPLLADFARTLPGKGLYIKHPTGWDGDSGPAEGKWFAARIERMSLDQARLVLREPKLTLPPDRDEVQVLFADAYLVRTEENAALLTKLDAGIAGDVSIGFRYAAAAQIQFNGIALDAYRLNAPGEALEGSLVWLGAQPGARAVKGAQRGDNPVDFEKQWKAAQAEVEQLKTAAETGAKAATALDALRKALGEHAALLDAPPALVAAVIAGKTFRTTLIDDIVTHERHRGVIGDDEASVASAKAVYADYPVEKLQKLGELLGKSAGAQPGLRGGDPNKPAPGAKALPTDHLFANPLICGAAA